MSLMSISVKENMYPIPASLPAPTSAALHVFAGGEVFVERPE